MTAPDDVMRELTLLTEELDRRQADIRRNGDYYDGVHGLHFASKDFSDYFADRYKGFADNWCQVVADAPAERLEVTGIRPAGFGDDALRSGDQELWTEWLRNDADALSDQAMLEGIINRRGFGLVWVDADDKPRITWEDPSQAIVRYDPETGSRRSGLKRWCDDTTEYTTMYLPDGIYKWSRRLKNSSTLIVPSGQYTWERREPDTEPWPIPNPLGVVPLVELSNRPRLIHEPLSDIEGTIAMQNAINLLWSYLLNAADFASFPQRVVLNAERPKVPVLDDNGKVVGEKIIPLEKFATDRVLFFEDPNAKIAEWSAADLELYTRVIEVQVGHIASQTRTPHHYLIGKMVNLSAEALKAAETGLVKRTEEKAKSFGRGIREIFALVAQILHGKAKADAVRRGTVLWRDIETRSEAQRADALLKKQQIGYPFEWLAEKDGLSPSEIDRVKAMRKQEMDSALFSQLNGQFGDVNGSDTSSAEALPQ